MSNYQIPGHEMTAAEVDAMAAEHEQHTAAVQKSTDALAPIRALMVAIEGVANDCRIYEVEAQECVGLSSDAQIKVWSKIRVAKEGLIDAAGMLFACASGLQTHRVYLSDEARKELDRASLERF